MPLSVAQGKTQVSDRTWEQKVRERAYAIWEREGRPDGAAERHWAMAETELRAEGVERLVAPTTALLDAHPPTRGQESVIDNTLEVSP